MYKKRTLLPLPPIIPALIWKVLFVTAALSYNFSHHTKAQEQAHEMGIRTGLNFFNVNGIDGGTTNLSGANLGIFYVYSLSPNIGLNAEINYMMKGTKHVEDAILASLNLNYLEMPVFASYIFPGERFRPKLFAGPYFSYLLTAKDHHEDGLVMDAGGRFKNTDLGAIFGAGLNLKITENNWLMTDIRYNFGLHDISPAQTSNLNNRGLSINIGFSFPL